MYKILKVKCKKGFSLIEMLIAMFIMGIVSVGFMSFMQNTAKQQRSIQAKDNQKDISSKLRSILSNREGCVNTFGGKAIDAVITEIKDSTGNLVLSTNSIDGSGLLKIDSMQLENWAELNSTFRIGAANLKVILSKTGEQIIGSKTLNPDSINIQIKTNATGLIVDCIYAGQLGNENFWSKDSGGTNLTYEIGNVSIGHTDPKVKLDVNGEIKVGNTNVSCDVNTEGSQRYNTSLKAMEFCDGIAWQKISVVAVAPPPPLPAPPPPIAVNCVGSWSSTCSAGVNTYTITTPASGGGSDCPYYNGETSSAGCPSWIASTGGCVTVNPIGCGSGTRTTSSFCRLGATPFPDSSCIPPKPPSSSTSCSGGPCIRSCFTGETLVKMENGLKKIQDIQLGERVIGKNGKLNKVIYKYQNQTEQLFFGINGNKEFITGQHPILSKKIEWLVFDLDNLTRHPWQDQTLVLRQARIGDVLYDNTIIQSINSKKLKTLKYNIATDGDMMFYANDILSHSVAFSYKGETEGNSPKYEYEFSYQGYIFNSKNAEKSFFKDGKTISKNEFMNYFMQFNKDIGLNISKLNEELKK